MLQPQNQSKKYEYLFASIDSGTMKIPVFQREFVWKTAQTAKLIDSIIKGFPIGTFIFWKTREELRHVRDVGNVVLPPIPAGDAALYVLDGQQRITSLYAVRKGVRITKDGEELDYSKIAIDLSMSPDAEESVVFPEPPDGKPSISVHKLLNGTVTELARDYTAYLEKVDLYRQRLTGYDFSTIMIEEYPIDIACEVFTRINTGGTELTLFEIMVAKTYDKARDFDLARAYEHLLDNNGSGKDLEDAGYDTVPAPTVLQCVSVHLRRQARARDILKIQRGEFIDAWDTVCDGLFAAVDYMRSHLRIPVSLLLPYHALLVPFTYYFIRKGRVAPNYEEHQRLQQYFWWASLSNRFSSAVESKLAQDIERMEAILAGRAPSYTGEEVSLTLDMLRWRWFSTGDAFCKAILCLYAHHQPLSFASNSSVTLDNSWLKVASSKNYHHFFPKSFLTKKGVPEWKANSILNITLVDEYLNKRRIAARAPSVYMREFEKENPKLVQTMRSHLIEDIDEYGIWTDNYENFIEKRGQHVLNELYERLGSARK
jgi:hypothetical protein